MHEHGNPAQYLITTRYIESLRDMTRTNNSKVIFMPVETSAMLSSVGAIKEVLSQTGTVKRRNEPVRTAETARTSEIAIQLFALERGHPVCNELECASLSARWWAATCRSLAMLSLEAASGRRGLKRRQVTATQKRVSRDDRILRSGATQFTSNH